MGVSKTTKTYASRYKTDVSVSQTTNTGFDATTRILCSGDGADSSMSASDDVFSVKPVNDDTTGTMLVKDRGGSNILAVDTTNKRVLCGSSQINALTQYKTFNAYGLIPAIGAHMVIPFNIGGFASSVHEWNLGTGTDPAETLDISAEAVEADGILPFYWYLPDAITVVNASVLMGGENAQDSTLNFHLMSYAVDTSTNFGDLSDGEVVIDSGTTSAVDEDVIKIDTMNGTPADVATGRVLLATVESDTIRQISVQIIVKYHIR
tara:strand:- start:1819 stop:2610 length:792 start_codon:yes stop_codon:yes gene_type:complete